MWYEVNVNVMFEDSYEDFFYGEKGLTNLAKNGTIPHKSFYCQ